MISGGPTETSSTMTTKQSQHGNPGAGPTGSNPLEPLVTLAMSASPKEAADIINQALEMNGAYVFGELMDVPNIQQLEGTEFGVFLEVLRIFAFGTYQDYLKKGTTIALPPLTSNQKKKLQHLTIVSLAEQGKYIPYKTLLAELEISNLRELEDLIIEAIYSKIIDGKLDQRRGLLEVDTTIGRDIRKEDILSVTSTLESWCDACESVLTTLQTQVARANAEKTLKIQKKEALEAEIANLKKTVKSTTHDGSDDMITDSREATVGADRTPRKSSKKVPRGGPSKLFK